MEPLEKKYSKNLEKRSSFHNFYPIIQFSEKIEKFEFSKLKLSQHGQKLRFRALFFANIHIFIGETDSVIKNGGHRQPRWGHFLERPFLRG